MLGSLFDREKRAPPAEAHVAVVLLEEERRRERVVTESGDGLEEEKWKFQAEMLRAECNLLRMEKEIAVKKLERTRSKMERTLRSVVHTLVSVSETFLLYFLSIFIIHFIYSLFQIINCIYVSVVFLVVR